MVSLLPIQHEGHQDMNRDTFETTLPQGCSGCYTSRLTSFYRSAAVHHQKNSSLTGEVYAGQKTPKSNFFFYPVWLTANKVTLLEITNAELTASSWTWQEMKVKSEKPQQDKSRDRLQLPGRKLVGQAPPGHFSFTNSNNVLFFSDTWQE